MDNPPVVNEQPGQKPMSDYRLYLLDACDHIVRAQDAHCPDDVSALELARSLDHGDKVEVWRGSRKIGAVG